RPDPLGRSALLGERLAQLGVRLLAHGLKGHGLLVGDEYREEVLAARQVRLLAGAGDDAVAAEDAGEVAGQLHDALFAALLVTVEYVVDALEGHLAHAAKLLARGQETRLVLHQQGGLPAVEDGVAGLVVGAAELRRGVEVAYEDLALAAELAEL